MAKRILLVDDEPLILKGLKYSLEQDGYEIESAVDGQEALDKFAKEPYDLIVLDVMLPKLDGLQVCQRIREQSNVPIIMLTAKGEDMDKILGLEYGADDYMTKPFNMLEVKARIKTIFRRIGTTTTTTPTTPIDTGINVNSSNRSALLGQLGNLIGMDIEWDQPIVGYFDENGEQMYAQLKGVIRGVNLEGEEPALIAQVGTDTYRVDINNVANVYFGLEEAAEVEE